MMRDPCRMDALEFDPFVPTPKTYVHVLTQDGDTVIGFDQASEAIGKMTAAMAKVGPSTDEVSEAIRKVALAMSASWPSYYPSSPPKYEGPVPSSEPWPKVEQEQYSEGFHFFFCNKFPFWERLKKTHAQEKEKPP
jgi:hypothetical protein